MRWGNTSAYFNGDQVLVELLAYPNTGNNRVVIDRVTAGLQVGASGVCMVFGDCVDERVSSLDPRAGRLRFSDRRGQQCPTESFCTAFLFNGRPNCLMTAGHCCEVIDFNCPVSPPIVEFNVPASDLENGTLNCSFPEEQYPVDPGSLQCECPTGFLGCGDQIHCLMTSDDWCYFGVFDNTADPITPHSPLQQQGTSYWVAEAVPPPGGITLRITGYGIDNSPLQRCGTQQTDSGLYFGQQTTFITYQGITVTGGNSGSAVERGCHGQVYAIHTQALCLSDLWQASGTRVDLPALQNALANPQGICQDCNKNGIYDACDIDCAAPGCSPPCGTSNDCNANTILDDCEGDCNGNGFADSCDIASGSSADTNSNGIPDECESAPTGACCVADAENPICEETPQECCADFQNAQYVGDGTACGSTGVCCTIGAGSGSCEVRSEACCTVVLKSFVGGEPTCVPGNARCCFPDGCCIGTSDSDWCQQHGGWFSANRTCADHCPSELGPQPGG